MDRSILVVQHSSLGERIKTLRKALELTQGQLGHLSGLTQEEISYYERAEREPSIQAIARLAIAMNVSTDWLLGLSEKKEQA